MNYSALIENVHGIRSGSDIFIHNWTFTRRTWSGTNHLSGIFKSMVRPGFFRATHFRWRSFRYFWTSTQLDRPLRYEHPFFTNRADLMQTTVYFCQSALLSRSAKWPTVFVNNVNGCKTPSQMSVVLRQSTFDVNFLNFHFRVNTHFKDRPLTFPWTGHFRLVKLQKSLIY